MPLHLSPSSTSPFPPLSCTAHLRACLNIPMAYISHPKEARCLSGERRMEWEKWEQWVGRGSGSSRGGAGTPGTAAWRLTGIAIETHAIHPHGVAGLHWLLAAKSTEGEHLNPEKRVGLLQDHFNEELPHLSVSLWAEQPRGLRWATRGGVLPLSATPQGLPVWCPAKCVIMYH